MKVLVTGGAGFIGANIAEYLHKKGYEITVIDNFSRETAIKNKKYLEKNYPEIKIIQGDICDFEIVKNVVKNKDCIIHCAAQVAVTTSMKNPREDLEINISGTFNLLEAARKYCDKPIFIYFSTNKVYGDNVNKIPLEELETRYDFADLKFKGKGIPETFSTDANAHTPYGVSKYAAELYVRDYACNFGIKGIANRCSCMYGRLQYGTEDQGWLAHFIISTLLKKPITIYGNGKQVRDILYVDDVVKLVELQIEKSDEIYGEAFNIGGGYENTISLLELLEELKNKTELPEIKFSAWRPADQKVYYSDITKARNLLGWKPKINKKEGISKLYEWLRETFIYESASYM